MRLIDFIIKAKLSGYAVGGEGREKKFRDGSIGFELILDGYRYVDRYHGFNPFAGSEHIYDSSNTLVWVMNYFGEIVSTHSEPLRIYSFLKQAMVDISPEFPFRGPEKFKAHNLRYENRQQGSIDRFYGNECIYEGNETVYVLYYHGGRMQKTI